MEKNSQLIAAKRAILNSHYGIDPKPLDCCGWIGVWPSTFEDAVPKVIRDKMKDGDWVSPWSRTINDILPKRRVNKPQVYYISSACYSDNTKQMLDELKESFDKCYHAASQWEIIDNSIGVTDWIKDVVKYTQANLGLVQPYCKIELNNEKEKEKMDAKKCERCGKLYEMQDADSFIHVYLPGLPVSDWNKENFTESRIRKDNSRTISINLRGGEIVDLCPECREKLKNFFEGGMDGDMELPIRDINAEE